MLDTETPGLLIRPRVAVANGSADAEADVGQESVPCASGRSGTSREGITEEAPGSGAVIQISVQPVGGLFEALVAKAGAGCGSLVLGVENTVAAPEHRSVLQTIGETKPRPPAVVVVVIRR